MNRETETQRSCPCCGQDVTRKSRYEASGECIHAFKSPCCCCCHNSTDPTEFPCGFCTEVD